MLRSIIRILSIAYILLIAIILIILRLLSDKSLIIKEVFINNTLVLKDLNSIYLIINYKKFNLGVEFSDDLLEIISSKIKNIYCAFSDEFGFIDATSLIVEYYLLIYIFLIANTNIKRR